MAVAAAPDELHLAIAARLRRSGQRATPNRNALVQILLRAGRPVTIPEILETDSDLAQSSVYRNLQLLEQRSPVGP
jgi:Fe2+ or Zn2+ uptake regulation protein